MLDMEFKDVVSVTRDEEASRATGLTVKYFEVDGVRISSVVILQKKNSTHYAVEVGLGMEYVQGGWTVKKRVAYWDNSQPTEPELRPQGWHHAGQDAWCMGTFHSAYNINSSLVDWFTSSDGLADVQMATIAQAKAHAAIYKKLLSEVKVQNALFEMYLEDLE